MTAVVHGGPRKWSGSRNEKGHREYRIVHIVEAEVADGPQVVMEATGLPAIASAWNFDDDYDQYALCHPTMKATIHEEKEGDPNRWWRVEQTFSTQAIEMQQPDIVEFPLDAPQKVSGSFTKFNFEVGLVYGDTGEGEGLVTALQAAAAGGPRNKWLATSTHEPIRGVMVDKSRPTVRVEQNVPLLELGLFSPMVDTLNDAPLWGLDKRMIKLSNVTWERKLNDGYTFFYARILDFEVDFDTFDGTQPDWGTKAVKGEWVYGIWVPDGAADKDNPQDFNRFKDHHGENIKTFLDGNGNPVTNMSQAAEIDVIYYKESNFTLLGIPLSF